MGVCASSEALDNLNNSLTAKLKAENERTTTSLAGIRRTEHSDFEKLTAENLRIASKITKDVATMNEKLNEESKRLAAIVAEQQETFKALLKQQEDLRVLDQAKMKEEAALLRQLAEAVVAGKLGTTGAEATTICEETKAILSDYRNMKMGLAVQWRQDIYTLYELHCAEELVDGNDYDDCDEEYADHLEIAKYISLKNAFSLHRWGGKKWKNDEWVLEGGEDETEIKVGAEAGGGGVTEVEQVDVEVEQNFAEGVRAHFPEVETSPFGKPFFAFLRFMEADAEAEEMEVPSSELAVTLRNVRRRSVVGMS